MAEQLLIQILERLAVIETKLDTHKDEIEEIKEKNKWLWRTVAGAFIVSAVGILKGVVEK